MQVSVLSPLTCTPELVRQHAQVCSVIDVLWIACTSAVGCIDILDGIYFTGVLFFLCH